MVVLITGAGSGLGRAAALQFARQGDLVIVSDIHTAGADETVQMIQSAGGAGHSIPCDVSSAMQVEQLMATIRQQFGRLDAAVNNAGIGGNGLTPTHQYDPAVYEQVMAVNATGVFLCMRAELALMLEQGGGAIVNVSSAAGLIAMPNNVAYTASKHAVVGMTRAAALEYARKNIRVNAVCPAFTATPMVDELIGLHESMEQKLVQSIPMKRLGKPEEIAEAIVWLCSDKASFINGHALALDGGLTAG
jgi:NAD(P)-dependent dehydrogenase (short-subunit alcohol dehydrogenase family)